MNVHDNPARRRAVERLRGFMTPEELVIPDRMAKIRGSFLELARDDEFDERLKKLKTGLFGEVDDKEFSIFIIVGESHAGKSSLISRGLGRDRSLDAYEEDGRPKKPLAAMEVFAPASLRSLAVDALNRVLGYVKPLIADYAAHGVAPLFPVEELDAFLARLLITAPTADELQLRWLSLRSAAKAFNCRLACLLELLFQGRLQSARSSSSATGFEAVMVDREEVETLVLAARNKSGGLGPLLTG